MKLNKINISLVVILFTLLGVAVGLRSYEQPKNVEMYNDKPLYYSTAMLMYDTSTPEKAVGVSDYAFVAKINKILRTEYTNRMQIETGFNKTTTVSNPYTVYEIEVVENIKGSLKTDSPIEFMQYGGLNENGDSYTFIEGGGFLNDGEYYILMVDTWGDQDGGTIEVSDTNRIVSLGNSYNPNVKSSLVTEYEMAYQNQVVPTGVTTSEMSKFDINFSK